MSGASGVITFSSKLIKQAPSTITIHHELFPSTTFTIGTERKLRGIKQVELSGPVTHLRRQILASLKSVLGDEVPAFDISGPFTTCVPTLLVTTLLGSDNLTRSPPEPPDDLIGSIRTAFLMTGEIDVETLAWLTRSTIESRGISSHTVLDVVEVLIDAIRTAPAQPQAAALSMEPSDDLWIRYVHLFRALSGSISREYTLDPVVRVIESQLRDHRHQYDPATVSYQHRIIIAMIPNLTCCPLKGWSAIQHSSSRPVFNIATCEDVKPGKSNEWVWCILPSGRCCRE